MKVTDQIIKQRLRDHCLHITRSRIEILSLIYSLEGAVSTGVITEASGYSFDRITVYRTLQVFYRKGILKLVPNTHGIVEFLLCDEAGGGEIKPCPPAIFICDHCNHQLALQLNDVLSLRVFLLGSLREIVIKGLCVSCKAGDDQ